MKAEVGRTAPPVKSVAPVAAAAHTPRAFPNALHFTADIVTTLVLAKKYDNIVFSVGFIGVRASFAVKALPTVRDSRTQLWISILYYNSEPVRYTRTVRSFSIIIVTI